MWAYTLMLPSIAKSGWLDAGFIAQGPWGLTWLRPEQLLGLQGFDGLTHSLFWSMLVNAVAYVGVSLWRVPSGREASQALLFVDVFQRTAASSPVFWRGRANTQDLLRLCERFLGGAKARALFDGYAQRVGVRQVQALRPDARLVQFVETQLAGAVGSASARALVASVAEEETLSPDDVLRILDEASQIRAYSRALEGKSRSLEQATAELRAANEQLQSLDRLKDDFMSSVTHELRTPLTSIRALAELMQDDTEMSAAQRQQFIGIIVAETERLTRLVNQVLDMAKIESGHAEWHVVPVDMRSLVERAVATTAEVFRERAAQVHVQLPDAIPLLHADPDRVLQVLLNLLSNAAKFVPSAAGQVQVRLTHDDEGMTVCVQDNGPGVEPGHETMIFDRFHQTDRGAQVAHGTGLGLPISRHIAEHFGGRLWLEPTDQQGACFCFWLPIDAPTSGDTTP
jgi:signal transduction histidine kinase